MYQLGTEDAHVRCAIREPLRLVWEYRAFEEPRRSAICVSPRQYHCRIEAGTLRIGAEELVAWGSFDTLLEALGRLQSQLQTVPREWAQPFRSPTVHFAGFSGLLFLASRGALAIRTRAGLWCQAYEHGWPKTAPFLVDPVPSGTGLMVTAALSRQWCPGLPFTREAVEQAIPEAARPHVSIEWHEEDDIVPECAIDRRCVLRPENIGRWL